MRPLKLALALLLLLLIGLGALGYRALELAREPYRGFDEDEVFYTVARGASGAQVASELEGLGVIRDRRLFVAALRLRDETGSIQAGEYRFSEPASTLSVLDRLVAGDIYTFSVTVPEGLTLVETAEHLSGQGIADRDALVGAFSDERQIEAFDPDATNLEGYLFPTTYQFTRDPAPSEVARTMVTQFRTLFDDARRARSEELGLTPREVVTLASVIEKETGAAEERPLIGSVFWNRLKRGMPLGSDPTIIYALKLEGRFDGNLRRVDLAIDSPYNTYRFAGLPPGPIASPGEAAIDAVLYPAESSYLYFVSKNDGTHHFSKTLREHSAAVRKYQVEYFRQRRRHRNDGTGSP
jgi:UPF0755 protein